MYRLARRTVLTALPLLSRQGFAFGDASRFVPALLQYGAGHDARASGLKRLAFELQRRTSVESALEVHSLKLTASSLFEHPLVVLSGTGELPAFQNDELESLRRYLTFGGLLWAESTGNEETAAFDAWFRREMVRVFPQQKPAVVPSNHVLYKSFYLLDSPVGRQLRKPQLEGWVVNKRLAVLLSPNDVLGALNRDETGRFEFDCLPGGERQREMAIRLAINVVMYGLCLDYKDDAVHLPEIMKRRR